MSVPRALISDDIRQHLDEAELQQVLGSLYPVDCQTCGRSLGRNVPVVRVVEGIGFAMASLHHQRCKPSEWQNLNNPKIGMYVLTGSSAATLSFRTRSVLLPSHREGVREDQPMLVVNPGLETINLTPDDTGRWRVNHDSCYHDAGLVPPGEGLRLDEPIPGASATLPPGEVCVRIQGDTSGPFTSGVPDGFHQAARDRGGVVLAVTYAIDPSTITGLRDMHPVLRGDRTLMGLAGLQR